MELPGGHATVKVLADSVSSLDSTPRCARGPSPASVLSLFLVVASRLGESGILLLLWLGFLFCVSWPCVNCLLFVPCFSVSSEGSPQTPVHPQLCYLSVVDPRVQRPAGCVGTGGHVQRAVCALPSFSPFPPQRHLIGGGHSLFLPPPPHQLRPGVDWLQGQSSPWGSWLIGLFCMWPR